MTTERTYPNNPVGRSFVRSMGGAALGCLTVILLALPSGLSLLLVPRCLAWVGTSPFWQPNTNGLK